MGFVIVNCHYRKDYINQHGAAMLTNFLTRVAFVVSWRSTVASRRRGFFATNFHYIL